jgi:hypothetical protein
MGTQKLMWIAWPAFLAACLLELVVFAFVDPTELEWGGNPLAMSRQGVYTASFFVFWAISLAACWLTTLLRMSPAEVNECPFGIDERPPGCPGRTDSAV